MDNQVKDAENALVYIDHGDLMYPLDVLVEAAHVGSPGKLREEIDWWFEAALTHDGGVYEDTETRVFAFKLHNSLLKMIEIAHYLNGMEKEERKQKLLAAFR